MKQGALPSQVIKELINGNHIINGNEKNVQPASIDLTVGDEIFRLTSIFLPKHGENIREIANQIGAEPYSFDYPLEKNTPYLIKLREDLNLPENVYAYANPKSSTGRCGIHATMLADGISRFDAAGRHGYKGTLWVIVRPEAFRVKLNPGDTLLQLRLFYSDTRFRQDELEKFFSVHTPLYVDNSPVNLDDIKVMDRDGGLIMTVDLRDDLVGWRSEGSQKVLDFSKKDFYDPQDFFQPIRKLSGNSVALRQGDFYILYTREKLSIPIDYASEMLPVDVRSGEYRSHYAGFIDPGFGFGDGSIKGTPLVLEVKTFEDNLILRDNQPVAKVIFESVAETPHLTYGLNLGSHYSSQTGPRLSKHFKSVR
jgi:dCTP deaminase